MEWIRCPQCCSLAALEHRTVVRRSDRTVTYATVRCVHGHWLSCPMDALAANPLAVAGAAS